VPKLKNYLVQLWASLLVIANIILSMWEFVLSNECVLCLEVLHLTTKRISNTIMFV